MTRARANVRARVKVIMGEKVRKTCNQRAAMLHQAYMDWTRVRVKGSVRVRVKLGSNETSQVLFFMKSNHERKNVRLQTLGSNDQPSPRVKSQNSRFWTVPFRSFQTEFGLSKNVSFGFKLPNRTAQKREFWLFTRGQLPSGQREVIENS